MIRIVLAAALALTGCTMAASSGQLPEVRSGYNEAIARSNNEQLLLNIVRLRYLHSPQFFEVASVTSQSALHVGGNASLNANFGNNLTNSDIFTPFVVPGIGGDVFMEDRPTVQYSPLQGEAFAQRMVTPIRADTLLQLVEVGWRIDSLLLACVQRVNDLSAPVIASDSDDYGGQDFRHLAELLYQLQTYQMLEVTVAGRGEDRQLVLAILPSNDPQLQERADEVRQILGLDPSLTSYRVVSSHVEGLPGAAAALSPTSEPRPSEPRPSEPRPSEPGPSEPGPSEPAEDTGDDDGEATGPAAARVVGGHRIVLRGRSLLGALLYLSHGVEVAAGDATARSLDFVGTSGETISVPPRVPNALMQIRSGDEASDGAMATTFYRGRHYHIDDADQRTKRNFLLLSVLFSVLSSSTQGAPVLTIPVGG